MADGGSSLGTFLTWYEANHRLFAIPLRRIGESEWEFASTKWLVVTLVRDSIVVTARHLTDPADRWDEIAEFDAIPLEIGGSWVCRLCRDLPAPSSGPPQIYRSRKALLINHVFEPLLGWVNDKLAGAESLGLYGEAGNMTWAKLLRSGESDAETRCLTRRIPL